MHTSGRSTGGKLGLAFALLATFAGAAWATQTWVQDVPAGDAYVVNAVLVPGCAGADVVGGDRGQGHVDFRIGFGVDLRLSVNGVDAGVFDPSASYCVMVACQSVGPQWFATTRVTNQATGALVFEQMGYPMPGAAQQVRAQAEAVVQLSVQ